MRPKLNLRSRPVQLAVSGAMLAIPASAVALTAGAADAQSALRVTLDPQHLTYGQTLTVTGNASSENRGHQLLLEFSAPGGTWRPVGSAKVHTDGSFRIAAALSKSGTVRVIGGSAASARAAAAQDGGTGGAGIASSAPQSVAVSARILPPHTKIDAPSGQSAKVAGTLLPGQAGRVVILEGRRHGRWSKLATGRTLANGHFTVRYPAAATGQQPVRVRFAGDRLNGPTASAPGKLTVYRQSLASWYSDGGSTACGFHAKYGVANTSLPCGTKVTFRYGGRTVTATVDDRGPYVGGREWDLNQNTAGALKFDGVGTVWSSK
jgi:hypothetical protein